MGGITCVIAPFGMTGEGDDMEMEILNYGLGSLGVLLSILKDWGTFRDIFISL